MGNEIKITKNNIYLIFFVVLAVIVFFGYRAYSTSAEQNEQIYDYKKAVYESIVCQYSCDLIKGETDGQEAMVPDTQCISACILEVRNKGFTGEEFSEEEILQDDLFLDIDTVIQNCKAGHLVADDVNKIPDFSDFYSCVIDDLSPLTLKYEYLN